MPVSDGYTYIISGSYCSISDYDPATGSAGYDPIIPYSLDGYIVNKINNDAMDAKSLTSVTINYSIELGSRCFKSNSGIDVALNATVRTTYSSLAEASFDSCNIGTGLTIGPEVRELPDYLFYNSGLTSVSIPSKVRSIGASCFRSNSIASAMTLPKSLTFLDQYAFQSNSIPSVVFQGEIDIQRAAFKDNSGMTITAYKSLLSTDSSNHLDPPFSGCAVADGVTLHEGVEEIGKGMFVNCGLTEIDLPRSLTTIGSYCFGGNISLTEIVMLYRVASVGEYAFISCTTLETVKCYNEDCVFDRFVFDGCMTGTPDGTMYGFPSSTLSVVQASYSDHYAFSAFPYKCYFEETGFSVMEYGRSNITNLTTEMEHIGDVGDEGDVSQSKLVGYGSPGGRVKLKLLMDDASWWALGQDSQNFEVKSLYLNGIEEDLLWLDAIVEDLVTTKFKGAGGEDLNFVDVTFLEVEAA